MDRRDFLGIDGLGEEDADQLLRLIDELTVVEGEASSAEEPTGEGAGSEDVRTGDAAVTAGGGSGEDGASEEVPGEGDEGDQPED